MVAISFSVKQMKPWILNGLVRNWKEFPLNSEIRVKRQTIRKIGFNMSDSRLTEGHKTLLNSPRLRYNQIRKLKKLSLYWKQRTLESELLGKVDLKEIYPIRFYRYKETLYQLDETFTNLKELDSIDKEDLAFRDGFNSYRKLYDFFHNQYGSTLFDYYFCVIRW